MRARSGIAAGLPQTNKNGPVTRKGKLGQKKNSKGETQEHAMSRLGQQKKKKKNRILYTFLL